MQKNKFNTEHEKDMIGQMTDSVGMDKVPSGKSFQIKCWEIYFVSLHEAFAFIYKLSTETISGLVLMSKVLINMKVKLHHFDYDTTCDLHATVHWDSQEMWKIIIILVGGEKS